MTISVFTPCNDITYLQDAYQSLLEQTEQQWEWVVIPNNGAPADLGGIGAGDLRVKKFQVPFETDRVGALKNFACSKCTGDILVELDHDDILMPNCLERVQEEFDKDPEICMVYSNSANMDTRTDPWLPVVWSEEYGWSYRELEWKGRKILEARSAPPYPQSISRIWFAPNHVRAWRAADYNEMGGHDQQMLICDDHDMVQRSYLYGKISHIDECLYIYRVHGDNTWLQHQEMIQDTMWDTHDKYIERMMAKWAGERHLRKLDLCAGINPSTGPVVYETVDVRDTADVVADLNGDWPFEDNSVGLIRAQDAFEHLRDPQHTMMEMYRVLAHGGVLLAAVPSTDGRGAFQDPTHISYWNSNSWQYYTNANMNRFIDCPVRFQVIKVTNGYMDQWGRENEIPYTFAHLIAVKKDEPRFYGPLTI